MRSPIALKDVTIHPVIEQPRCTDFGVMAFFPALTKELLDDNRPWLETGISRSRHQRAGALHPELRHQDAAS
jgi:hypothetical protein